MLSVNIYKAKWAMEALNEDGIYPCGKSSFGPNYLTEFLNLTDLDICKVVFDDLSQTNNLITRQQLYTEGFYKDGIHYVRLGRTAGAAKNSWAWFINEDLYEEAIKICCANVPEIELVGYEAYKSLCFSDWRTSICLDPDSMVIIDDFSGVGRCIADKVKVDENKQFYLETGEGEYSYNIWDGQGLIDYRLIDGEYASIRAPFTKCNALATDLQMFFREKNIKTITDKYGVEHNVEDVKLITTPSSFKWTKWEKYGYTFDDWKKHMNSLNNVFGICKEPTDPKYLDGAVRASYQMCMMIPYDRISNANLTQKYVSKMIDDTDFFMEHCKNIGKYGKNSIVNDLDSLSYWRKTKEFASLRTNICKKIVTDAKEGKILISGNNLTLFGDPLKMLYNACSMDVEDLPSLDDSYACYTQAFDYGSRLCGMRSPFNAPSMSCALTNVYEEEYEMFFPSVHHSIFVNAISSFQDRSNGSD